MFFYKIFLETNQKVGKKVHIHFSEKIVSEKKLPLIRTYILQKYNSYKAIGKSDIFSSQIFITFFNIFSIEIKQDVFPVKDLIEIRHLLAVFLKYYSIATT